MSSPPKPWETAGGGAGGGTGGQTAGQTAQTAGQTGTTASVPSTATTASTAPPLPSRDGLMRTGGMASSLGGMGGLGGLAGPSSYGMTSSYSPYRSGMMSGYGGLGMGMGMGTGYGGYGGYGGMGGYGGGGYGSGYGTGYGGMAGGYGSGAYGSRFGVGAGAGYGPGDPMNPGMAGQPSLGQRMEAGTQATFQIIESIVGAFGGFAQMLESTFMATHSSFFAMVGVAEQFGHLRNYLGQVLSIFNLIRWFRSIWARLTGRPMPLDLNEMHRLQGSMSPEAFAEYQRTGQTEPLPMAQPGPSRRPLVLFLMTVVGLPWLMSRFIRMMTRRQEAEQAALMRQQQEQEQEQERAQQGRLVLDKNGEPMPNDPLALQAANRSAVAGAEGPTSMDPSQLEFARATYDFQGSAPYELSFRRGDLIAILERRDAVDAGAGAWWRGRTRGGEVGYFPSNRVSPIVARSEPKGGGVGGGGDVKS